MKIKFPITTHKIQNFSSIKFLSQTEAITTFIIKGINKTEWAEAKWRREPDSIYWVSECGALNCKEIPAALVEVANDEEGKKIAKVLHKKLWNKDK